MATTDLDEIGIKLMLSVEGDVISINDTSMQILETGYYTDVTGTGDTVPHLFKFRAVDAGNQGYIGEVLWNMSDDDDRVEEALISKDGRLRYGNIGSIEVVERVDHPRRPKEERLMELYEEAKEEYEDRKQPE